MAFLALDILLDNGFQDEEVVLGLSLSFELLKFMYVVSKSRLSLGIEIPGKGLISVGNVLNISADRFITFLALDILALVLDILFQDEEVEVVLGLDKFAPTPVKSNPNILI
jgi:hypothetical protein